MRTHPPQVDPETERIIKQKAREAIGHLLDVFGDANPLLPSITGTEATAPVRVLNQ